VAILLEEAVASAVLAWYRPDVVYANTVKAACYARPAIRLGIPIVLHVHELEPLASSTLVRYHLDGLYGEIGLVACSHAAASNLAAIANVPEGQVTVVPSMVDADQIRDLAATRAPRPPPAADRLLRVGACGTADHRKGIDLWLRAAAEVAQLRPDVPVRFVWIGRYAEEATTRARSLGIGAIVDFVGEVDNPFPTIAGLDVFTLPSRVDPFPLVVLEAMALGLPVVAFAVDGVPDQVGDAGVLVPPGEPSTFASAIAELLDDDGRRRQLGVAAAARVREHFDISRFRTSVVEAVEVVTQSTIVADRSTLRYEPRHPSAKTLRLFLLHSFDASALAKLRAGRRPAPLPYRAESITRSDSLLELSDAEHHAPWSWKPVRAAVAAFERALAPFLQVGLATRRIARSDSTIAMFESQGNTLAALRAFHIAPFTRPFFGIITCWLARDLEHFGVARKALYRRAYRSVDALIFFSPNQAEIFERELGMPAEKLHNIAFGVDDEYFRPDGRADAGYVLAVGRDAGRDWSTLLDAVRGSDMTVKVACRPHALAGLAVPANVEQLGYVDRTRYRDLLAAARVVVVASHPCRYPTGQSVTLEAMAMAKCCVVTDTEPMRGYVRDGEDALLVPPGDPRALRAAIERACDDDAFRARLGASARRSVEESFNAPLMWRRIAEVLEGPPA
jgi:glycosyltransferase involved in cell wall biosynthesis